MTVGDMMGIPDVTLDEWRLIASEDSGTFCLFGKMNGNRAVSRDMGGYETTFSFTATSADAPEPTDSERNEGEGADCQKETPDASG